MYVCMHVFMASIETEHGPEGGGGSITDRPEDILTAHGAAERHRNKKEPHRSRKMDIND